MITGTFSQRRAYVNLTVRGSNGQEGTVEFVLDTGFTGALALPDAACSTLGLIAARIQLARLADGSRVVLDVYEAALAWNGGERVVEVLAIEGAPLLGMSVLYGSRLLIDVIDGGPVTITPLP
jgi:clan AA aspartic protease